MKQSRRYVPTNSVPFTWLLRVTYGALIRRIYGAEATGLELAHALEPPFVVVANHAMILDPFMINTFVPRPIHWIAADGNMRNPLMRFLLLKLVGSIPKSKAIPDMETINWIVQIIRKQKGVVGFFPEGQSSWNGTSVPAPESTAKLLKLLKVPVLAAKMNGFYLSKPRWSYVIRRGPVRIDFSILFTPEDLAALTVAQIDERLEAGIRHDDWAWSAAIGARYPHPRRAERLELALYTCPSCGAVATLRSQGARLACTDCGFACEVRDDARMHLASPGRAAPSWAAAGRGSEDSFFETIAEWDAWQESALHERIARLAAGPAPAGGSEAALLSDRGVRLLQGKRMDTMRTLGTGTLELYPDRLLFRPEGSPGTIEFPLARIEGAGVLKWNHFEFYVGMSAYRARFPSPAVSGRKWAVFVNALRERLIR